MEESSLAVCYLEASSGAEEILRPMIVVGSGRRYRKLKDPSFGARVKDDRDEAVQISHDEREVYTDDVYDEGHDVEVQCSGIDKMSNGEYRLQLPIPSIFFKYIIGREGRVKKGIERETGCRVWLPSKMKKGDVVIEGPGKTNVVDARRRVEIIVWTNRDRERPTHFISIPLTTSHIRDRLLEFISSVINCYTEKKRSRQFLDLFQDPAKLHLTIGVLRIFSADEEERAKAVVRDAIENALPLLRGSVVLCVEGIDTMNDDPTAVDVLFAKVFPSDHSNRLKTFVTAVHNHVLKEAPDLMSREYEREGVKLHATVMNTHFPTTKSKEDVGTEGSCRRTEPSPRSSSQPFDATNIFKEFREFHFGQLTLETIHLSKRKEYGLDGYYRCVEEYKLSQTDPSH